MNTFGPKLELRSPIQQMCALSNKNDETNELKNPLYSEIDSVVKIYR